VLLKKYGKLPQTEGDFIGVRQSAEFSAMEQCGFANVGYLQLRLGHLAHRVVSLFSHLYEKRNAGCVEKGEEIALSSWTNVEELVVKALTFAKEVGGEGVDLCERR